MTDVDAALVQHGLDIVERKGKANVHHDCQAEDLRTAVNALGRVCFRHEQWLRNHPARLKQICSDKTSPMPSKLLKKSSRLADESRVVAHVEVEVADELSGGSHGDPPAAGALVAFIDALPGELGDQSAGAGVIADVEPGLDGDEAHLAFRAIDHKIGGLDEVERLGIPEIHLGDAPTALERRCQRRELLARHQPAPAISFGSRTRL